EEAADKLYGALAQKREKLMGKALASVAIAAGEGQKALDSETKARNQDGTVRRLWAKDKSLWTNDDEDKWLGWLDVVVPGGVKKKGDGSSLAHTKITTHHM